MTIHTSPISRLLPLTSAIAAAVLLAGAGLGADRIALFNPDVELDKPLFCEPAVALLDKPLKGDKRENLFAAFDALWQANNGGREPLTVPHGAPYGSVELKEADCTLCMGCVAVCPSRALHAVGHAPGLNFIEQDCIQCGMCEKACPEQAIVLVPRLQPVPEARRAVQSLKAEEAACCIRCSKPFAPASLIRRIQQKLAGHSHFQNEAYTEALRVLAGLRAAVDRFFDEVMVMADEPLVRQNRLALLAQLAGLMNQVADISRLSA